MSGVVSSMADNLAVGKVELVFAGFSALLSFLFGAVCTAALVNWGRRRHLQSEYAMPLMLEAALLLGFGVLGSTFVMSLRLMSLSQGRSRSVALRREYLAIYRVLSWCSESYDIGGSRKSALFPPFRSIWAVGPNIVSVCPLNGDHLPSDTSTWRTALPEFDLPRLSSAPSATASKAEIASCNRLKIRAVPIASVR
jgi:hypothetical protein